MPEGLGGVQWVARPLHGRWDQSVSQVQPTLIEKAEALTLPARGPEGMLRTEVSCFSITASC